MNKERILKMHKHCFVVFSNPRLVAGHMLVIPKRHVEKLSDLSKKECEELFGVAVKLQDTITRKLAPGCDMSQHHRPFIKQGRLKINHLHVHLIPRKFKDELYRKVQHKQSEVFKDLTKTEARKMARLLFE
jgi:histidine triad (HIT) family protein